MAPVLRQYALHWKMNITNIISKTQIAYLFLRFFCKFVSDYMSPYCFVLRMDLVVIKFPDCYNIIVTKQMLGKYLLMI